MRSEIEREGEALLAKVTPRKLVLAIVVLAVLAGVLTRLLWLDARPLHHDEAIHSVFSWYWWDHPSTGGYRYDPTYHGPFLYWVVKSFYAMFGFGVAEARLFPLVFGLAVMALPLLLSPWMGWGGALMATGLVAVSPTLTYYSRFLAHDMPTLFCCAGMVACFLWARRGAVQKEGVVLPWLCLAGALLGILFSIKAIAHMWVVLLLFFFVYFSFWSRLRSESSVPSPLKARLGWPEAASIAAVFVMVYAYIQTSEFRYLTAFWDGLAGKVFTYWWGQHSAQRLRGPTTFHLRSMFLHELPVALALMLVALEPYWSRGRKTLARALAVLVGALFFAMVPTSAILVWSDIPLLGSLTTFFRISNTADLYLYGLCAFAGLGGTWLRWERGERWGAFLNYWAFAAMAMFTFVGEKVPWLTVHVAFPAILLVARDLGRGMEGVLESSRARAWVSVACLAGVFFWQARLSWYVTIEKAGAREDLLSQVHNTSVARDLVDGWKRLALEEGLAPEKIPLALVGEPTWAFYFYLIHGGFRSTAYSAGEIKGNERIVITDPRMEAEVLAKFPGRTSVRREYDLNGWFVPEHTTMTWFDWGHYMLTREPPNRKNGVGGARFVVLEFEKSVIDIK